MVDSPESFEAMSLVELPGFRASRPPSVRLLLEVEEEVILLLTVVLVKLEVAVDVVRELSGANRFLVSGGMSPHLFEVTSEVVIENGVRHKLGTLLLRNKGGLDNGQEA